MSSLQTVRFKNELERNITIKLGYANAKIYKCEDDRCPRPMCYKWADKLGTALILYLKFSHHDRCTIIVLLINRAYGSGKEDAPMCDVPGFENARMKLLRHVSFVDCPVSVSSDMLLNQITKRGLYQSGHALHSDVSQPLKWLYISHYVRFSKKSLKICRMEVIC